MYSNINIKLKTTVRADEKLCLQQKLPRVHITGQEAPFVKTQKSNIENTTAISSVNTKADFKSGYKLCSLLYIYGIHTLRSTPNVYKIYTNKSPLHRRTFFPVCIMHNLFLKKTDKYKAL